jgi:hypothetical protein
MQQCSNASTPCVARRVYAHSMCVGGACVGGACLRGLTVRLSHLSLLTLASSSVCPSLCLTFVSSYGAMITLCRLP